MSKKEDLLKEVGQEKLRKAIKKSLETTMIGALSSMEKYFGELWGHDSTELTKEQQHYKNVFEAMRSEILDKGNIQIRNLPNTLGDFDITRKTYTYNIPIMKFKKD